MITRIATLAAVVLLTTAPAATAQEQPRTGGVLKQTVVVGFQDGTEAEVPLEALTWEGRPHIQPL